jgi:hypothetical protein
VKLLGVDRTIVLCESRALIRTLGAIGLTCRTTVRGLRDFSHHNACAFRCRWHNPGKLSVWTGGGQGAVDPVRRLSLWGRCCEPIGERVCQCSDAPVFKVIRYLLLNGMYAPKRDAKGNATLIFRRSCPVWLAKPVSKVECDARVGKQAVT